MKTTLADFYLEYLNNWLTPIAYSDHHQMYIDDCNALLRLGRQYHEERAFLSQLAEGKLS